MGGTEGDIVEAEAEAEVHTDIRVMTMTTVVMDVVTAAEDMMIGMHIMRVGARVIGAVALGISGEEAEVLVVGEREVPLGKEVKRDVLKLSNGIGKRKKLNELKPRIRMVSRMTGITMVPVTMKSKTMDTSNSGKKAIDIKQLPCG